MKKHRFIRLFALFVGIVLFCSQWVHAQRVPIPVQPISYNSQAVIDQLARANVVYLGETHNKAEDHLAQLQIIEELHRRNPNIAIGMEMFQRPFQFYIDRFLANDMMEPILRERTQYNKRWGFPWEYYAPILRFAKANRLPVLALNAPTEIIRKVARSGLESLSSTEQQFYIPPLSDIRTDNQAYRQLMQEIYQQSHQGLGKSNNFERFFQAQVVWDETMADVIAKYLKDNPDFQVVVLAGQGHIVYGHGIPSRVARRLGDANIVQRTVLLNPPAEMQSTNNSPIAVADFVWRTTPGQ
ncbi:MAG TPA: ChaN family lipoprotein [Leptolyngbyaceae cyanobacterium]